MKQSLTIACLLGLGLPSFVRAQVYEDEDLLTNKKRKTIETKQAQVSQANEPDMMVRAPLVVPVIDPSLDVTLFLSNGQELPAREGSLDVPAGFLNVKASRTTPSGKVDTLEYAVDVPADGTYLPLPRILDLYVGGVHQHTWFQSHQNSDPPTDLRILLPNRMNALPATAEGLLLPEGETVRIDLPKEHPAFQAHSQWSKEKSVLGSYHLVTLTGVVGGIVLAAVGSTWMIGANELKQQAESIDDPSLNDQYQSLNNQFKKTQKTGWAFVGAGAAIFSAGLTIAFGPTAKKAQRTQEKRSALDAILPIQLTPYASESSLAPQNPFRDPEPAPPPEEPKTGGEGVWGWD